MKKIKNTFEKVNDKILSVKDKIFQTKEQEIENWLFSVVKKSFFNLPLSIRTISFSLFLFVLWRGLGADTFFSIYIKSIVDNVFWVALIGAILPLTRLLFALPIWELDDNTDRKSVILLSKMMYIVCWLLFFVAWIMDNHWILLAAVIFNGIASSTLFVTYESYIHISTNHNNSENSRWLYFSSINLAYVIWAIVSSFLIWWFDLHFLFLFIVLFSILSLFTDRKIPITKKEHIKNIFWRNWFLKQFIKKVFSVKPFFKTFDLLKRESNWFFYSLGFEWLWNILNYLGFLFIPLIAAQNNLWLWQIALLFALMRLPYITNFFTATWSQRFDKKLFIAVVLLFLSFLYSFLAFEDSFIGIMIVSFGIALGLSMIRPVISALISEQTDKKNTWSISGVQTFVAWIWSITGSIGFGIISVIFGMQTGFSLIGLSLFVLAIRWIAKKMKNRIRFKKY